MSVCSLMGSWGAIEGTFIVSSLKTTVLGVRQAGSESQVLHLQDVCLELVLSLPLMVPSSRKNEIVLSLGFTRDYF